MAEELQLIPCRIDGPASRGTGIPLNGVNDDFERIYRSYSPRVFRWCLRMSKDWAEAEDLTQEAFLQLFRKLGTFRGESAFSTWLYRLVVNVALMRFRKKSRVDIALSEDNESEEDTYSLAEVLGAADTRMEGAIDRLSLEGAIIQLPPGFRRVLVLHDVEGYEHNEIASILGVSEGTSKSQLHKARLRLRDLLRVAERNGPHAEPRRVRRASCRQRKGERKSPEGTTSLPASTSNSNDDADSSRVSNPNWKWLGGRNVTPGEGKFKCKEASYETASAA